MNAHFLFSSRLFVRIGLALAAVVVSAFSTSSAQAQMNGYDFGIGWGWAQQSLRLSTPREDLPYFAKFPPVYYGDMIRRPYGFSPYALPPGIEPVEQRILQETMGPRTILNPFCEPGRVHPAAPITPAAPPAAEVVPALPSLDDDVAAALRA